MTKIAEQLMDRIRRYGHLTFVEATNFVASHGIDVKGDLAICGLRKCDGEMDPNLILWAGMSQEFVDVMAEIRPHIDFAPESQLTYLFDGAMLTFPIVQRPPSKGYASPHWLPVSLKPRAEVGAA